MGKKKRVIAYTGSLIQHMYRYMLEANFKLNLLEKRGFNLGQELFKASLTAPKKFLQPKFKATVELDHQLPACYFDAKFINGWEQRYYLHEANYENIKFLIQRTNYVIEGIRNFQNFDDELQDEASQLK